MKNFNLFIPITKVDVAKREVYGIATAEQVDKSGEIMDYATTKPHYKDWSAEIHKASGGKSLGNIRAMHGPIAAGKVTQMVFNDDLKQIEICAKIVDDAEWKKVEEGVYTGFSHGGEYVKRWKDEDDATLYRYTAKPAEISIVDNPCLGSAVFEMIRADGTKDMVKFKSIEEPKVEDVKIVEDGKLLKPKHEIEQVWKSQDGKTFPVRNDCIVHQLKIEATGGDTAAQLAALSKTLDEKDGGLAAEKLDAANEVIKRKNALVVKLKEQATVVKGYAEAYDCKTAIEALCIIECLISGEEWEAMMGEGEDSQIADLKEAISRIKSFIAAEIMENETEMEMSSGIDGLVKYIKETKDVDVKEAICTFMAAHAVGKAGARHSSADKGHLAKALGHLEEAKDGHEDVSKAHGKMGDAHESLGKCFGKLEDCMKVLGDSMKKGAPDGVADFMKVAEEAAGGMKTTLDEADGHLDKAVKQHGKMGKSHTNVGTAHDGIGSSLEAVGAEKGDDKNDDDATKAIKDEMAKLNESVTALTKSNEELTAKNVVTETEKSELQKNFDAVNKLVPELTERVTKLEKTPIPAKGALYDVNQGTGVVALNKDHGRTQPDKAAVEVPQGTTERLSPEEMRQLTGIAPTN